MAYSEESGNHINQANQGSDRLSNCQVFVYPELTDYHPSAGIRQYENKELHLPGEERFYPSVKRLREHRGRFGYIV